MILPAIYKGSGNKVTYKVNSLDYLPLLPNADIYILELLAIVLLRSNISNYILAVTCF